MDHLTRPCPLHHDHLLAWNNTAEGDLPIWRAVEIALSHAEPLILEGFTEPEYVGYLEVARTLVRRAAQLSGRAKMYVDDTTARQAIAAMLVGVEYMDTNNYAADDEFPDDAWAARVLQHNGRFAASCFAPH